MKRDFILTPSGKAASALSCVALSLLACAQAGAQVAPPQAQGPDAVRVGGAGGGAQGVRSGAEADWMLQLKSGQLSPEEAWQRGLLTASNTGRLIWSAEITGEKHKDLRLRMAGLLAERAPEVLGPKVGHPELQNLAGYYYRTQKDARAVGFLEATLEELLQERQAQMKSRTAGDVARKGDPKWITPLGNLAMFYSETGQFLKAAQTWSRGKEFSTNPGWLADALVETARAYAQAGDAAKAKAAYDQVPQYGQAWYSGLALYDQFRNLIGEKKYGEARALLNQPVIGANSEQAKVMLLSASGELHYIAGEWLQAKADSQAAISLFQSLKPKQQGLGLDAVINMVQARLSWIQQWIQQPMIAEPKELNVTWRRGQIEEEPRTFKIRVRSGRAVPLQVSTNSGAVNATIKGESTSSDYFSQQEIKVTIQPEKLSKGATVEVRSADFPNLTLNVPIRVETQNAVALSSSTVFFGEVRAGQAAQASLQLSAPVPFRILAVTSDNASVKVQPDTNESGASHTLKLTFTPPQVGGFYSGTLRVQTDVPNEEVIEVPYFAHAK